MSEENFAAVESKIADMIENVRKNRETIGIRAEKPNIEPKKKTIYPGFCPELVLMAASTGGPPVLRSILSALAEPFPAPILIVQHMLPQVIDVLVQDLDKRSKLHVKLAQEGELAAAGMVYIAPDAVHMKLSSEKRICFDDSEPINGIRPAADALFESAAEARPWKGVLAVILTGMGSDGTKGLAALKARQKCLCLAQSEASCAVYGMPRAAAESGLVDKLLDAEEIAWTLNHFQFSYARSEKS